MCRRAKTVLSAVALLALAAPERTRGQAKGPAFDCAKAQGEVQQLVCKDEGLAALDRKLDEVYRAARAKATNEVPPVLVAEQRGWLKGRDDCWKARGGTPTFLTASWQVDGVHGCVEATYTVRISELQAKYRLLPPKGPVSFLCDDRSEVVGTFFETDPPTARLERGDQTVTAWLVKAASGSRYEGPNVEFWTKGKEATATWLESKLKCTSR
jgi:uncharacterized protein YecT (DUF1311 family)